MPSGCPCDVAVHIIAVGIPMRDQDLLQGLFGVSNVTEAPAAGSRTLIVFIDSLRLFLNTIQLGNFDEH